MIRALFIRLASLGAPFVVAFCGLEVAPASAQTCSAPNIQLLFGSIDLTQNQQISTSTT